MSTPEVETNAKPVQNGLRNVPDLFGELAVTCGNPNCDRVPPEGRKYCNGICRAEAWRIRKAEEKANEAQKRVDTEREAWAEFDMANPDIYNTIELDLMLMNCLGKLSVGAVIEYKIRMLSGVKVPNAYKKFYREKFIAEHPEYKHLFK